jgi:capsular polysaccharide biosynthesis protein
MQLAVVHGPGIIETSDHVLIAESFRNAPSLRRFSGFYRVGDSTTFVSEIAREHASAFQDGKYVLLRQLHDTNYGHWLVECLPRVDLIAEVFPLNELHFVVSNSIQMRQVYLDSLSMVDIREDQIVFVDSGSAQFRDLIFATPITHTPWILSPRSIRSLESIGKKVIERSTGIRGGERLYVSRNRFASRKIVNEDALIGVLSRFGYTIVYPETLTFFEQVWIFSSATHVVGNLGAALTNLVFCPQGVKLFALVTELMHDDFYVDLQSHKRGEYYSLHGIALDSLKGMWSDFTISVHDFEKMLVMFHG